MICIIQELLSNRIPLRSKYFSEYFVSELLIKDDLVTTFFAKLDIAFWVLWRAFSSVRSNLFIAFIKYSVWLLDVITSSIFLRAPPCLLGATSDSERRFAFNLTILSSVLFIPYFSLSFFPPFPFLRSSGWLNRMQLEFIVVSRRELYSWHLALKNMIYP